MKNRSQEIIAVNSLTVNYSSNLIPILKKINLKVLKGQHLAIIGPSGCGKSTLAKSLVRMLPSGSICKGYLEINMQNPYEMDSKELQIFRRRNFGFIYQDSIKKLNPLMTVGDHLRELLRIHWDKKSNYFIEKSLIEIFRKVRIDIDRLNCFPHEFSGGMRQRVCIALAIALNPPLLIADEPTTSLDSKTSYEIMEQLLDICDQYGSTLVLISHDINLAAKWCKNIIIMNDGQIKEQGEIKSVLSKPNSMIGQKLVKANFEKLKPNKFYGNNNEPILEVINLRCWYRLNSSILKPKWNKALDEISFQLFRNETLGIVGISGCGKSTLCRALIGLIKKRGGSIKIFDNHIQQETKISFKRSKIIQMIFQDPFSSLNPKMTIKNILEDVCRIHFRLNKLRTSEEIITVLQKLDLPYDKNFLNSYPHELSGGQLQRVSIARVLLIKPKILICDESVNMLDAAVKIEILKLLKIVKEKIDLSIIFITHDLGLAKRFCNRLIVMNKGKIVEEGEPNNLFKSPQHPITKKLLQSCLSVN